VPSTRPVIADLIQCDMPEVDGIIQLATHAVQGDSCKTASTERGDENDPLSVDPRLDMYDPDNGYRPPPEPTHFLAGVSRAFSSGPA